MYEFTLFCTLSSPDQSFYTLDLHPQLPATGRLSSHNARVVRMTNAALCSSRSERHGLLVGSSLPPRCLLVASLLPPPCLLVASSLPPRCLLPASSLLPRCLLPAFSLPPRCFLAAQEEEKKIYPLNQTFIYLFIYLYSV